MNGPLSLIDYMHRKPGSNSKERNMNGLLLLIDYMEERKELEIADRMIAKACGDDERARCCTGRILMLADLLAKAKALGIAMKEANDAE